MIKKTFTEAQKINILSKIRRGDDLILACEKHGITLANYFKWRTKYGGMELPDFVRLRNLKQENKKLKVILAERDLEIDALKEFLIKKK